MQPLSAEKILDLWETGRPQHALDRALTILTAASPGASRDLLADLSIGERDARLLQLRALLFGSRAEGFAECPRCSERVEFPLDTARFTTGGAPAWPSEGRASARPVSSFGQHEIEVNGTRLRFRLPNSRDLAEAITASDHKDALQRLISRCVLQIQSPNEAPSSSHPEPRRRRGTSQPVENHTSLELETPAPDVRSFGALRQPQDDSDRTLSPEIVEALSRAMLEADPEAEIMFRLTCPACAHEWELLFDVAEFFWTEISAQAQRLLREIDALARAYGWTEREILNLPAQRRQTYLEMLAA